MSSLGGSSVLVCLITFPWFLNSQSRSSLVSIGSSGSSYRLDTLGLHTLLGHSTVLDPSGWPCFASICSSSVAEVAARTLLVQVVFLGWFRMEFKYWCHKQKFKCYSR